MGETMRERARAWLDRMDAFGDSDVESLAALLREQCAATLERMADFVERLQDHYDSDPLTFADAMAKAALRTARDNLRTEATRIREGKDE